MDGGLIWLGIIGGTLLMGGFAYLFAARAKARRR